MDRNPLPGPKLLKPFDKFKEGEGPIADEDWAEVEKEYVEFTKVYPYHVSGVLSRQDLQENKLGFYYKSGAINGNALSFARKAHNLFHRTRLYLRCYYEKNYMSLGRFFTEERLLTEYSTRINGYVRHPCTVISFTVSPADYVRC
jgi:hypothetical protein